MKDAYNFLELARDRYSVRSFQDTPVKRENMDRILAAGHAAPTACNRQPQRILVIESQDGREKLKRCTECHFDAPAALLICYDSGECWNRRYDGAASGEVDASIVTTHMMLQAHALGVGTTWVMFFVPEAVRAEFSLPDSWEPVALLVMGYPAPSAAPYPAHAERRPPEEIVSYV